MKNFLHITREDAILELNRAFSRVESMTDEELCSILEACYGERCNFNFGIIDENLTESMDWSDSSNLYYSTYRKGDLD